MKKNAKFTAASGGKLTVRALEGRRGINVGVTVKNPGEKALVGCQSTFELSDTAEAQASAEFDKLCADAITQGWTLKPPFVRPPAKEKKPKRATLIEIPRVS